jgi:hypothetical protein
VWGYFDWSYQSDSGSARCEDLPQVDLSVLWCRLPCTSKGYGHGFGQRTIRAVSALDGLPNPGHRRNRGPDAALPGSSCRRCRGERVACSGRLFIEHAQEVVTLWGGEAVKFSQPRTLVFGVGLPSDGSASASTCRSEGRSTVAWQRGDGKPLRSVVLELAPE